MSNKSTFKELCQNATVFSSKVSNATELNQALPIIFELVESVKVHADCVKRGQEIIKDAFKACSDYAIKHPGCFDNGLNEIKNRIKAGDITLDGVTYHFESGYNGYKRKVGGNMTKEFLESLPENWYKQTCTINTSGINAEAPTDEELDHYGLKRNIKHDWSIKE